MRREEPLPPLGSGDLYVYAHANSALSVYRDGSDATVPLAVAEVEVRQAKEAKARIWVAGDDHPVAVAALARLGTLGARLEPFAAPEPPHRFGSGKTPLNVAASNFDDAALERLLADGADPSVVDEQGANALHHAARQGNLPAIETLVRAGAPLEARTPGGMSAYEIAVATGHDEAARLLERLGAVTTAPDLGETVTFSRGHVFTWYLWVAIPLIATSFVLLSILWGGAPPYGLLFLAPAVILMIIFRPPNAYWAGGIPRTLDGRTLTLRRVTGQRVTVDLGTVTYAALGGWQRHPKTRRPAGQNLLLAVPDGTPVSAKDLRRLAVPSTEIDEVLARAPQVVDVLLESPHDLAAVSAISGVLRSRGVPMSPLLRWFASQSASPAKRRVRWWQY